MMNQKTIQYDKIQYDSSKSSNSLIIAILLTPPSNDVMTRGSFQKDAKECAMGSTCDIFHGTFSKIEQLASDSTDDSKKQSTMLSSMLRSTGTRQRHVVCCHCL